MTAKEFLLGLPTKVSPQAIEGLETIFHFDIDGDEGGQITLSVKDGVCEASEGLLGAAKCVVRAKDKNLMKLLKGDVNPMMALLTGQLKISNQSEMLKYAKIFGLM